MRKIIIVSLVLAFLAGSCKNQIGLSTLLSEINGQNWQVRSLNSQELDEEAYSNFKGLPELTFNNEGVISGHSGCNGFRANYRTYENQEIEIRPGAMTKMYCRGVDENGFIDAIKSTRNLKMDGENLLLVDSIGNEKMRLEKI